MADTTTAWGGKAREVLADGEWHDLEPVLRAVANVVPPGRAFRVGERDRNRSERRPGGSGARVRGDDSTSIANGARLVARQTIDGMVKRGRAERDGDRVRLVRP